ncbi:Hypothetical_protein [Hexamita inflata]|uniref:Hypothetical_protein n=1 Tax=Hexamita inflata TaxID=28002 RepID=A0ABP1GFC0_9EUKA
MVIGQYQNQQQHGDIQFVLFVQLNAEFRTFCLTFVQILIISLLSLESKLEWGGSMHTLGNFSNLSVLLASSQGEAVSASGVLAEALWLDGRILILGFDFSDLDLVDEGQDASDVLLNVREAVGSGWGAATFSLGNAKREEFLSESLQFVLEVVKAKSDEIFTRELLVYCVRFIFIMISTYSSNPKEKVWNANILFYMNVIKLIHIFNNKMSERQIIQKKDKQTQNSIQSYDNKSLKLKKATNIAIFLTFFTIIFTIIFEIYCRKHKYDLQKYITKNIRRIHKQRIEYMQRLENDSTLQSSYYREHTDNLEPWQQGRHMWLRDQLIYQKVDGTVVTNNE